MLKSLSSAPVLTVKHILADGDLVVIHWHSSSTPNNESTGQAGFDIFRLDNGTIVEHWDVIQDVPVTTASGNSMFSDLYKYANGAQNLTEEQEEANKQLVIRAYDGVFNGRLLGLARINSGQVMIIFGITRRPSAAQKDLRASL